MSTLAEGLRCSLPNGSPHILICASTLEHVANYRQISCWKREAGGQLFAQIIGNDWKIAEATGPRRGDIRTRFGFRANRSAEQREIEERFSVGLHYVGDWHTHPEEQPKPSSTDLLSMQQMVSASRHELPGFIMMIVGTSAGATGIWLSLHRPGGTWAPLTILTA